MPPSFDPAPSRDEAEPVAPPPAPDEPPRWPPWYGPAAFFLALAAASVLGVILGAISSALGARTDSSSPTFTLAATLLLDAVLVASAVLIASLTRRPRPWHFGLRPAPLRSAFGWALLGLSSFYLLTAVYTVVFHPSGTQTVVQDLGANRGTASLIAAGIVVIVFAPLAEELFFRGFFYRALRTRFSVLIAALIDGLVFGAIHYTGTDTLSILPLLALLGFIFCLVYERVGSLYPVVALHALNNAVAYGAKAPGATAVSTTLCALVIAGCVVVPWLQRGSRAVTSKA